MKKLIVLALLIGIVLISGVAFARDMEEVGETVWDTARGANENCPLILEPYIAKTWKDAANLPLVGKADVRVKLGYEFDSHKLAGGNQLNLSAGLEF